MPYGVPDRCYAPSGSPLLGSWTDNSSNNAPTTTTTQAPEDVITIPPSGLLCGQIATTEPPNEIQQVCRVYTVQTLDNERDAVISIINCTTGIEETYTMAPNTCLFLYSLIEPLVVDPGFGPSNQQPGGSSGSGSGNGNDNEDNGDDSSDEYVNENGSVAVDTDGDGTPDIGVVIDPPLACEILPPVPTQPEGGGDTIDGDTPPSGVTSSDAGTGGGVTGQPPQSGINFGVVYDGPEASGMFCGGADYDPEIPIITSGNWVKIASVGYGTVQGSPVYSEDGNQMPYTYRPNAVFVYGRTGNIYNNEDEVYSTYVIDKEIPTIYDSDGSYTYQEHRELAFETPKQVPLQATIATTDPNGLKLLWDNYRNKDIAGNPGYIVIESTIEVENGLTNPMYTFVLSDGYDFTEESYNASGITIEEKADNIQSIQDRTYRFILNGLDFQYNNFKVLNNLIPRDRVTVIDGGDIFSPEFFSWDVDAGETSGYGWDSGTYRLALNDQWLSETHTTYEHKLIPVIIDEDYKIDNQDFIAQNDGWYPRNTSDNPSEDKLVFDETILHVMEDDDIDINNIFLEVVTATSYTENPVGVRPDGTNFINGSGPEDMRPFPRKISTQQTKRSLFTFGPSGNFIDLLRYRNASILQDQPSSSFNYYEYEILSQEDPSSNCFTDECNDRLFTSRSIDTNYWNMDISIIDIAYPSGHEVSTSATQFNNCAPCSEVMDCCPPFAVSQKSAYDNYQDFVVQGSGYVPINFYPCTISDKIATMRGATLIDPSPDLPTDEVTTTEDPSQVGGPVTFSGGWWDDVRGCYQPNGQINEHTFYERFTNECNYSLFYANGRWELWQQCLNESPGLILTNSNDTGVNVPLTGWDFGYIVENGCV